MPLPYYCLLLPNFFTKKNFFQILLNMFDFQNMYNLRSFIHSNFQIIVYLSWLMKPN